ncbi:MAG: hypothetical protein HY231_06475 [Acidobacteria bacterium]|nr:hypothetical protein [Acidobacteriota bacterium]
MQYSVIVENKNGIWRAFIPALADLSAEGTSEDEAVNKAQQEAEKYLSAVKIKTIEVNSGQQQARPYSTAQELLEALGNFVGDEEALREHFAEIAKERQRQREEAQRQDAA